MYLIKWRNRATDFRGIVKSLTVVTGVSRYQTVIAAEKQIIKWQQHFPTNSYYIEHV